MMRFWLSLLLLFPIGAALAQIPGTLSYQGILTDNNGNPVADGTQTILFNFYTAPSGGSALQTRGPLSVTSSKGLFMAVIGNGQGSNNAALPFNISDQQIYIGIVANGGAELSPRVQLTAVPYAFRAAMATALDATATINGMQVGTGINANNLTAGTLPIARVADGTVTNAKLASDISASKITTGILALAGSEAMKLPTGSTAQRPTTALVGQIRYNTTENVVEYFNGTNWYFVSPKIALIKDEKTSGTQSGAFTAGIWTRRDLNTVEGDNSFLTLNANQISLSAGEYIVEAHAPAYLVNQHKLRLFNVTNNAPISYGSNAYGEASNAVQAVSYVKAKIGTTTNIVIEVQHYCATNRATNGLGILFTIAGTPEVFTQVTITKLR